MEQPITETEAKYQQGKASGTSEALEKFASKNSESTKSLRNIPGCLLLAMVIPATNKIIE